MNNGSVFFFLLLLIIGVVCSAINLSKIIKKEANSDIKDNIVGFGFTTSLGVFSSIPFYSHLGFIAVIAWFYFSCLILSIIAYILHVAIQSNQVSSSYSKKQAD